MPPAEHSDFFIRTRRRGMSVTDELTDRDVIRRRELPSSKVVAGLIIAGLLCVLVAKVAFDWPAFAAAIPSDVQKVAAARNGFVGRTYVYTFWGNIIDSEELWRVEVDADVLTDLVRNYQLLPLASTQEVPARFWQQRPYWWRPPRGGRVRYFGSPGFPIDQRGPDGNFYLMAYDEAEGILYVWYKNNF